MASRSFVDGELLRHLVRVDSRGFVHSPFASRRGSDLTGTLLIHALLRPWRFVCFTVNRTAAVSTRRWRAWFAAVHALRFDSDASKYLLRMTTLSISVAEHNQSDSRGFESERC